MTKGTISFGWGAPSFAEQLPDLPKADAEAADADNTAIIRLSVRGIITEAERDRAIKRATRRIEDALRKASAAPSTPTPASSTPSFSEVG